MAWIVEKDEKGRYGSNCGRKGCERKVRTKRVELGLLLKKCNVFERQLKR
jgi:hypothetical protein